MKAFLGAGVFLALVLACLGQLPAAPSSVAVPSAQIERIGAGAVSNAIAQRQPVIVVGTVLIETEPGFYFVDDNTGTVRVHVPPSNSVTLARGDLVEITGLPILSDDRPWLAGTTVRKLGQGRIPDPVPIRATDAVSERYDAQYVTVRGRVVGTNTYSLRGATNEVVLADCDGVLCKIMFRWGTAAHTFLPVGAIAEFTGVCRLGGRVDESATRYVHIVVHSPEAVRVLEPPPLLTGSQLKLGSAVVAVLALTALFWIFTQWRKVRLLRASEERFRALIENSFDATLVLNADGTAKYASPAAARLLGYPDRSGGPIDFALADVIHPEDLPIITAAHKDVLQQPGKSRRVERYRIIRKDGSVRYAEAIGTNCLHVPGVKGVVVNVRDITERELARLEIERSELIQRRINEFAVSLASLNTEEDIFWEVTRRCISALGFEDCVVYAVDEPRRVLVQKAAHGPKNPREREIAAPIDIPFGRGIVGAVAASGQAEVIADTSKDARYITDDAARPSEITVPIVAGERVLGVIDSEHSQPGFFTSEHLSVLTSIASLAANKLVRARAEAQLQSINQELERRVSVRTAELGEVNLRLRGEVAARESAEAELRVALEAEKELNQLKSSFVSMVSHEFRTPLEIILSSSNILDRYLDRLPAEKRLAQLRAIRKSVHRMNDLIEDVLLLGKFDASGLNCCPTPLDLAAFCERVVNEIESASGRPGGIRLVVTEPAREACGDEGLLQHIMTNLLSNAVKYSPPDAVVDFTVIRQDHNAQFTIHDRGCGIPANDQQRLFTAFYRGSNVGQTPGSGLGLVIVKRCVDLHGGTIGCESAEGEGTTFVVTLPLFDGTRIWRRRAEEAKASASSAAKIQHATL